MLMYRLNVRYPHSTTAMLVSDLRYINISSFLSCIMYAKCTKMNFIIKCLCIVQKWIYRKKAYMRVMSNVTYIEIYLLFFVCLLNNMYVHRVLCDQTCICIIRNTRFYISNLQYNQYFIFKLSYILVIWLIKVIKEMNLQVVFYFYTCVQCSLLAVLLN